MSNLIFNSAIYSNVISNSVSASCLVFNSGIQQQAGAVNTILGFGSATAAPMATVRLNVYAGTIENFSTFTSMATRASDLLVSYSIKSAGTYNELTSTTSRLLQFATFSGVNFTANATASGTAKWFLLVNQYSGTLTDLTVRSAMLGSVGTPGSGADLEIADTAIVSGVTYKCSGFYLNFPYNLTV